jgi:predicted secreted protein
MALIHNHNPIFKKQPSYTNEERDKNFEEFFKLANKLHKLNQIRNKIRHREDLHWKDELTAVIHKKDLNRFNDAVVYYTGSILHEIETISNTKIAVRAVGYWEAIGS